MVGIAGKWNNHADYADVCSGIHVDVANRVWQDGHRSRRMKLMECCEAALRRVARYTRRSLSNRLQEELPFVQATAPPPRPL